MSALGAAYAERLSKESESVPAVIKRAGPGSARLYGSIVDACTEFVQFLLSWFLFLRTANQSSDFRG